MNHDDLFENSLRTLERRELPAPWRDDILHAAAHAAAAAPQRRTPRWLVAGWGVAWAAALILHLATPATPDQPAPPAARAPEAPALPWQQRLALMEDLLASS